jgi:hypothetical protein
MWLDWAVSAYPTWFSAATIILLLFCFASSVPCRFYIYRHADRQIQTPRLNRNALSNEVTICTASEEGGLLTSWAGDLLVANVTCYVLFSIMDARGSHTREQTISNASP